MATTTVEWDCPQALELTLELYAPGSDTLVASAAAEERTNDRGCYAATLTDVADGVYRARACTADGVTIARGVLRHVDAVGTETVGSFISQLATDAIDAGAVAEDAVAEIAGAVEGGGLTAADVWSHGTRTLTQSAPQIAAVLAGSTITLHRGDTLAIAISGLGSLVSRAQLWFTAKNRSAETDAAAQLQVEQTAGLVVLAAATPAANETASITVDDEIAGTVTIVIAAAAAKKLAPTTTGVWDVQMRDTSGNVVTLAHGALKVVADVTQRIE